MSRRRRRHPELHLVREIGATAAAIAAPIGLLLLALLMAGRLAG